MLYPIYFIILCVYMIDLLDLIKYHCRPIENMHINEINNMIIKNNTKENFYVMKKETIFM